MKKWLSFGQVRLKNGWKIAENWLKMAYLAVNGRNSAVQAKFSHPQPKLAKILPFPVEKMAALGWDGRVWLSFGHFKPFLPQFSAFFSCFRPKSSHFQAKTSQNGLNSAVFSWKKWLWLKMAEFGLSFGWISAIVPQFSSCCRPKFSHFPAKSAWMGLGVAVC